MKSLKSFLVLGSFVLPSVIAAGNPATFWSDYPTCEDDCHQSVWASQSCSLANSCSCSGCLCLLDSCLCETSSWLTAVAQCIGEQCGSSGVIDAASIASSACAGAGYPLVLPSASLVSIGLAALPAATTKVTTQATTQATTEATTQETTVKSPTSSEAGGSVVQSGTFTGTTTVTNTPTLHTVSADATTPSFSTTSNLSSTKIPVASGSSALSSGAKAGIGIGAALAAIIIIALLAFIFYQRRKNSKLNKGVPATGGVTSTGLFELGDTGRAIWGTEKKNITGAKTRASELQGGSNSLVNAASQVGAATIPEKEKMSNVAEMAAPLSVEEKQELERRRRAAELSGAGANIALETGIGERNELEARRRVYEMA